MSNLVSSPQAFLSLHSDGPKKQFTQRQAAGCGLFGHVEARLQYFLFGGDQTPFGSISLRANSHLVFDQLRSNFDFTPVLLQLHRFCRYVSSNLPVCVVDHAGE